ncbi:MAG: hypothetical protein OZ921_06400, partial [Sorangiineae bacterium]|nr:hypothetical protein [Sorangiineae bacterium]
MGRRLFSRGMVGALVVAGAFAACSRSDLEGLDEPPAVSGSAGAAGADAAAGAAGADAAAGAAGADAAAGAAG